MSSENIPSTITRCLEEGAEEFFLKPVQPADLNKLRPHMMKTKIKNQKQENQEEQEKLETQSQQQQQPSPPPPSQSQPLLQLPTPVQPPNNNKKNAMEEGLSPDTTRPRCRDITTAV